MYHLAEFSTWMFFLRMCFLLCCAGALSKPGILSLLMDFSRDHSVHAPSQCEMTLHCLASPWLRISSPNFTGTSLVCMCRSLFFLQCHFQNSRLAAILHFLVSGLGSWHGFRSVTRVCFGISISNFICMLFVAMDKSLLNFRYVTVKMAAWRPYMIF